MALPVCVIVSELAAENAAPSSNVSPSGGDLRTFARQLASAGISTAEMCEAIVGFVAGRKARAQLSALAPAWSPAGESTPTTAAHDSSTSGTSGLRKRHRGGKGAQTRRAERRRTQALSVDARDRSDDVVVGANVVNAPAAF